MTHLLLERQQQILHSTSLRARSSGMTRQASKCKNVERCRKKGSKGCGELKFFGILHFAQDDSKGFADWGWATFAQDAGGSPQWTIKLFIASVEMTHLLLERQQQIL